MCVKMYLNMYDQKETCIVANRQIVWLFLQVDVSILSNKRILPMENRFIGQLSLYFSTKKRSDNLSVRDCTYVNKSFCNLMLEKILIPLVVAWFFKSDIPKLAD